MTVEHGGLVLVCGPVTELAQEDVATLGGKEWEWECVVLFYCYKIDGVIHLANRPSLCLGGSFNKTTKIL